VVFSTNKTDRHDITEILLKVALNTIPPPIIIYIQYGSIKFCSFRIKVLSFIPFPILSYFKLNLAVEAILDFRSTHKTFVEDHTKNIHAKFSFNGSMVPEK
jgi:hypothetical protein